jgi:hypothetical protein
MMLLKSTQNQSYRSAFELLRYVQMLYSPYFGSRSSSIKLCIDSGDGRTKHKHRRCLIFSRCWFSIRLAGCQIRSSLYVVEAVLGEVDLMSEEGGLGGRRGYDRYLRTVSALSQVVLVEETNPQSHCRARGSSSWPQMCPSQRCHQLTPFW